MPWRKLLPNRSAEYRARAVEARAKADASVDKALRDTLLQEADTWERMATWEDQNNPPRQVPGSN